MPVKMGSRHQTVLEQYADVTVMCDDQLNPFVMRCEQHTFGAAGLANPKPEQEFRVHISEETWKAICSDKQAEEQFYDDLAEKAGEWAEGPTMRYMVTDSGKYGEAARAALERERAQATNGSVDRLERLRSEVESLVLQAAEMRSRPSQAQAANFGTRLGELVERVTEERRRVQEIEAMLEFAKVAIMDVAEMRVAG